MGITTGNYGMYLPDAGEMDCAASVNNNFTVLDTRCKVNADAITALGPYIIAMTSGSDGKIFVRTWR